MVNSSSLRIVANVRLANLELGWLVGLVGCCLALEWRAVNISATTRALLCTLTSFVLRHSPVLRVPSRPVATWHGDNIASVKQPVEGLCKQQRIQRFNGIG